MTMVPTASLPSSFPACRPPAFFIRLPPQTLNPYIPIPIYYSIQVTKKSARQSHQSKTQQLKRKKTFSENQLSFLRRGKKKKWCDCIDKAHTRAGLKIKLTMESALMVVVIMVKTGAGLGRLMEKTTKTYHLTHVLVGQRETPYLLC